MKQIWVDRDECYMWFDVRPTYEALGNPDQTSEHVAKVDVSDEMHEEYRAHCRDVQQWQEILRTLYEKNKHE